MYKVVQLTEMSSEKIIKFWQEGSVTAVYVHIWLIHVSAYEHEHNCLITMCRFKVSVCSCTYILNKHDSEPLLRRLLEVQITKYMVAMAIYLANECRWLHWEASSIGSCNKKKRKKGRWPLTRVEEGGGVEMKITAITKLQSSVSHTAPDGCTDPTLSRVERGIKKDGGSWRRLSWRRERVTCCTLRLNEHTVRLFFILCRFTNTSV